MLYAKPRKHHTSALWPVVTPADAFKVIAPSSPEGWAELKRLKKIDANDLVHELGPTGIRKWLDASPTICLHRQEGRIASLRTLALNYKNMRQPIIHDLLRRSETMNIIAPPKSNKSLLVGNIAMNIIGGGVLFGKFQCERGKVLIVDNELHCETIVQRNREIAEAMNVPFNRAERLIDYLPLRGELTDLVGLEKDLEGIRPRQYALIILDAFYKFYPDNFDENSNSEMAKLYNVLDRYADSLESAFVLIHHSSKGNSAGKSVTDVGAGAGSQSRACDAHLVLRPHQSPGVFVIDVANRSFKPIPAFCARFKFPVWEEAPDADPAELLGAKEEESWKSKTPEAPDVDEDQKLAMVLDRITRPASVRDIIGFGSDLSIRLWGNDKVRKRVIPAWLRSGEIIRGLPKPNERGPTYSRREALITPPPTENSSANVVDFNQNETIDDIDVTQDTFDDFESPQ